MLRVQQELLRQIDGFAAYRAVRFTGRFAADNPAARRMLLAGKVNIQYSIKVQSLNIAIAVVQSALSGRLLEIRDNSRVEATVFVPEHGHAPVDRPRAASVPHDCAVIATSASRWYGRMHES